MLHCCGIQICDQWALFFNIVSINLLSLYFANVLVLDAFGKTWTFSRDCDFVEKCGLEDGLDELPLVSPPRQQNSDVFESVILTLHSGSLSY